jgi:hypothetical protein
MNQSLLLHDARRQRYHIAWLFDLRILAGIMKGSGLVLIRYSYLPLAVLFACAATSHAASASSYTVGSQNTAVIEPGVPHPDETPCVVHLVDHAVFGANAVSFNYAPPTDCPGPWATVVLQVDISLDKGIQYDRSGQLFLGGVPLWFGTTSEPTPDLGPKWHIETNVVDYSALYKAAQTGSLQIANYTNSTDTSVISASATLSFYKATKTSPAPVTADIVIPLPAGGGVSTLNSGTDTLNTTLPLPHNILKATLDLYLQGQSNDEFWYTCVPTAVASQLESCGNTALREGEISVDGTPAGVAPIYPWIFTGGIDPYLWAPIPGVQTLNFTPFHADLSPFAGVLSNPGLHTIATSVFGANQYFSANGALRLFLDPKAASVTGHITKNTLVAKPVPNIVQNLNVQASSITGTIETGDERSFTIVGTVTGSAGKTTNSLTQNSTFQNNQQFVINNSEYIQHIRQSTHVAMTKNSSNSAGSTIYHEERDYPLTVRIAEKTAANGDISQATTIDQNFLESSKNEVGPTTIINNKIQVTDTLLLDKNYNLLGNKDQSETASYEYGPSTSTCLRTLTAAKSALTGFKDSCAP